MAGCALKCTGSGIAALRRAVFLDVSRFSGRGPVPVAQQAFPQQ